MCSPITLLDAKAETPILWPPHVKSWLTGKDADAGRDWGQEKGTTEDEMAGWHHRINAHEFGWTPGVGDGQGGLACYNSRGCKKSDTTEQLNWTELKVKLFVAQSCPTLCDPMDCSPPGSVVLRILLRTVRIRTPVRILEWVAISPSMGSSWPRDWTSVPYIGRCFLYHWATREANTIVCKI